MLFFLFSWPVCKMVYKIEPAECCCGKAQLLKMVNTVFSCVDLSNLVLGITGLEQGSVFVQC